MPRYFFDFADSQSLTDDIGVECRDDEAACGLAKQTLADIVREGITDAKRHQLYASVVRNADGQVVYSATLTYTGLRLGSSHV